MHHLNSILYFVCVSIEYYYSYLDYIVHALINLICLLITVAFFTLAERKVLASVQRRKGPNVVGFGGLLQPFADACKLLVKEIVIPNKSNKFLFIFSPCLTLFLSLSNWVIIIFDFSTYITNLNNSLLFILILSSLSVYGILLSGWSSGSKYAIMGALRSVIQLISYEIAITLVVFPIILFAGSLNLNKITYIQDQTVWFFFPLYPIAIIFLISILAETNRAPFDLPEAEAELVAGYNIEYSGITFATFFLAEYLNILLMSSLFIIFFFGGASHHFSVEALTEKNVTNFLGTFIPKIHKVSENGSDAWCPIKMIVRAVVVITCIIETVTIPMASFVFALKTITITFFFIFVRANLPRFRFDQLLYIGWKIFLPISLGFIFFFIGLLLASNSLEISQQPLLGSEFDYIRILSIDS